MPLAARAFVFDLDGTLTVPAHDFAWLRAQLDIAPGEDILQALAAMPPPRRAAAHAFIEAWEARLAAEARAWPDAASTLAALRAHGCRLGLLTRNTKAGALSTLQAAGLREHFAEAHILGRDEAPAKPAPDGLLALLRAFDLPPAQVVMVGDWIHDLRAGRAAGCVSVLVRRHPPQGWEGEADRIVEDLAALLDLATGRLPQP